MPIRSKREYQNRPLPITKQQYREDRARRFERDQIYSMMWAAGQHRLIMRMGQHWRATATGFWKEAPNTS